MTDGCLRFLRRHVIPYWKTLIVVFTPLLLLPLPLLVHGAVSYYLFIKKIIENEVKFTLLTGSSSRLRCPVDDYLLAHIRPAFSRYLTSSHSRFPAA